MKKQILTVLVTAALAGGLVACNKNAASGGGSQSAAGGGGDVIHIATGSPLSGGQANAGKDFVNGVQLAVEEINAAGGVEVGGKKYTLKVTSEDDAGDPKTGATVAQKTADDSSVVAVIGHYNSGVTMVASPIYANAGLAALTVSTNPDVILKAPKLADGGTAVFRANAGDDKLGPSLAVMAQKKGVKNLVILDDATAFGKGVADQVAKKAKELGVNVVMRESATDKTTDFKALLTKAKGANADGIMWGGYDDTAATLTKQARELGLNGLILLPDTACSENYLKLSGAASLGAVCSSTVVPLEKLPKGAEFKANYEKKFPGQAVQVYAPITYDAVYALVDAIKKAGAVDKAKIAAAIPSVSIDGLSGKMAFMPNGERKDAEIAVLEDKGGKFEVIEIIK